MDRREFLRLSAGAAVLSAAAGYIGMMGSRRKRDAIYKELIDRGVKPSALEQVNCPIGLTIDAETPAEIAVSVVAQLIQHRARRQRAWPHRHRLPWQCE